jgi:hypothetical protein
MEKIVELTKDEIRICAQLGMERWLLKWGSIDRPNYAEGKRQGWLEFELNANIRANVAEYAVAKLYKMPWNVPWYTNEEHKNRINHPDVGNNLEVRCVRTKDAIPVWSKDVNKNAIIVGTRIHDLEYFSSVEIYGWLPVAECQKDEWWSQEKSGNCWRVPIEEFRDSIPDDSLMSLHV